MIERPRTGFAVVQFDETMLRNVFDIRAELDSYATTLAIARITLDEVEMLRLMRWLRRMNAQATRLLGCYRQCLLQLARLTRLLADG